jgi:DNA-binding IclR family transcriptional regulator
MKAEASMAVRTADRTLEIFNLFARLQTPLTVSEIGRELSLPTSTCYALVKTLVDTGFLYYLRPKGPLYPTKRLRSIADAFEKNDPLAQRIRPHLAALRDLTQETIVLGRIHAGKIYYLEALLSPHPIRYTIEPGASQHLHVSSNSKAILGSMSKSDRNGILSEMNFVKLTDDTILTREAFEANLEEGRRKGYWTNIGESRADVMGIACAARVFGDLYGLSIIGPLFRLRSELDRYVSAVQQAAERLSAENHQIR